MFTPVLARAAAVRAHCSCVVALGTCTGLLLVGHGGAGKDDTAAAEREEQGWCREGRHTGEGGCGAAEREEQGWCREGRHTGERVRWSREE